MNHRLITISAATALATWGLSGCGGGEEATSVAADSSSSRSATTLSASVGPLAADTVRPKARLTSPAKFADGLIGMLAVNATASDDVGVDRVVFQIDGRQIGAIDTTAPYGVTLNADLYPPGQHVIRAQSVDAAGNVSAWATSIVRFGGTRTAPAGFTNSDAWLTGLLRATAFAQLPDGRLLVSEQGGTVRVVKGGALLPTPFVKIPAEFYRERGLLGVAPHPNFATNGYVYVYYTTTVGGSHNRVSRFTANLAAGGDVAVAGSEVVLFDLPPLQAAIHNGGAIHFGPDGKLYVAVGDNHRSETSQDLTQPFGKLLRFNDDGSIPTDNPFYAKQSGLARSIWAYGLRNPYTFAFQPGTGLLHINDVGLDTWEEINIGRAGANYGWPASEGPDNVTAGITGPRFAYGHNEAIPPGTGPGGFFQGYAITGGTFYPTDAKAGNFPFAYRSNYYFADYVMKTIGRVDIGRNYAAYAFASVSGNPVDMLVGIDRALYVLTRTGISRISYP